MNVLFPLCFKIVVDAGPAGPFCPASNSVIHDQRGALQGLRMSSSRIGFDGAGSSGVELPKEAEDSDSVGGDEEVEIDLNDKPGSLLDSLNT